MNTVYQQETPTPFIVMNGRQLLGAVTVGAIVGLLSWGLALLFDIYVFKALFCQSPTSVACVNSFQYATSAAMVIAAALGVFLLVKLQIYRPLLVGISATVGLWGLALTVALFSWQLAALAFVLLFAVAYGLFAWLARIRSFGMTVIVMVVLVVAVRIVLNS